MSTKRSAVEQFGPVAAQYAAFSYHARGPDLGPMLEAAELRGHERVLDIGCGPGHTALLFAEKARQVVGLDPTEAMLAQGGELASQRGLANVTFELASAEKIPFADASFDRVTSRQSAHHYGDLAAALREVARVLRPDGLFLLIDTFAPEEPVFDAFLNRIELLRDPSHVRDYRVSEWRKMFSEVGFSLTDLQRWEIPLDFEDWVSRSRTPAENVETLRACLDRATPEIRARFAVVEGGYDWSLPIGLVVGRHSPAA